MNKIVRPKKEEATTTTREPKTQAKLNFSKKISVQPALPNTLPVNVMAEEEYTQDTQDTMEDLKTEMLFTRYYYVRQAVFVSLWIAILDKDLEEALFWAYELYYSNYDNEIMDFIMYMYQDTFKIYNDVVFEQILTTEKNRWLKDKKNAHHILGNMIANFVCRPYSVIPFLKKIYMEKEEFDKFDFSKYFTGNVPFYVVLPETAFDKYKTVELDMKTPHRKIQDLQKYKIRKAEYDLLMRSIDKDKTTIVIEYTYTNWEKNVDVMKECTETVISICQKKQENGIGATLPKFWHDSPQLFSVENWTIAEKEKIGMVSSSSLPKYGWHEFYNKYYLANPYKIDVAVALSRLP